MMNDDCFLNRLSKNKREIDFLGKWSGERIILDDSKLDDLGILINSGNLNLSFLFLGSKKNSLIIINTIIIIPKIITTVNI